MRPRFSVLIPVRDRADVIGRAVSAVLAQTFADFEVVVVDHGSEDDTLLAVRSVADRRVRVLTGAATDEPAALSAGAGACRGRWVTVLSPDDEVAPGWLARLGRVIDSTNAQLVCCGGEQRHPDGSLSAILPTRPLPEVELKVCFRPGAFIATRRFLLQAGGFESAARPRTIAEIGDRLLQEALENGHGVAHTPDPLVRWNEPVADGPTPAGDALRLRCSLQGLDALARTPIPDGDLLTRYAVSGAVAAARLRDRARARQLFRLARQLEPGQPRHWARWLAVQLPPLADRVWHPVPKTDGTARIAGSTAR